MRRTGAAALVATAAIGILALALVSLRDDRDLAFTIGVVPTIPAVTLQPGETVCQVPISVSEAFERVRLRAGSPGGPGQSLLVSVRSSEDARVLGRGRIPPGYRYGSDQTAKVGPIAAGQRIAVCVRNVGDRRTAVFGNAAGAAPPSEARVEGRALDTDVAVVFLKDGPRAMLSELPEVFDRASLFRPGWVGSWFFWVLAGLVILVVPALLARALAEVDDATRAP